MKRTFLCSFLALVGTAPVLAADAKLWDELLDVATTHIKREGPDADVSEFISMAHHHAWARRIEIVKLIDPFLTDATPEKTAAAIEVLYRFRSYAPMSYLGKFEADNAAFFADLDKLVYPHFDHDRKLKSEKVYLALALYLGVSRTAESKAMLLEIARSDSAGSAKEQALICLAWHRDKADMETLLPFMLEDSATARSLPYHFRDSYGQAAIPYLEKAVAEAKAKAARQAAQKELRLLQVR